MKGHEGWPKDSTFLQTAAAAATSSIFTGHQQVQPAETRVSSKMAVTPFVPGRLLSHTTYVTILGEKRGLLGNGTPFSAPPWKLLPLMTELLPLESWFGNGRAYFISDPMIHGGITEICFLQCFPKRLTDQSCFLPRGALLPAQGGGLSLGHPEDIYSHFPSGSCSLD